MLNKNHGEIWRQVQKLIHTPTLPVPPELETELGGYIRQMRIDAINKRAKL